jgi:hypothetical protein
MIKLILAIAAAAACAGIDMKRSVLLGHAALVDVSERRVGKWAEGWIAAEWNALEVAARIRRRRRRNRIGRAI